MGDELTTMEPHTNEQIETELNPAWQELMRGAIRDTLDNYELIGLVTVSPPVDDLENDDPPALSPAELTWANRELLHQLDIEGDLEVVETYTFTTPIETSPDHGAEQARLQGEVNVRICQTPRIGEDMYLHELTRPDGSIEYIVAPHDFRL